MQLDHERLDVYQASLDFAVWAFELCRGMKGVNRHARDQLLRASQSITLNIAEGCGKIPPAERGRYLQIASGSARESGAIIDILFRCGTIGDRTAAEGKHLVVRIVAMLTRMIDRGPLVREDEPVYGPDPD